MKTSFSNPNSQRLGITGGSGFIGTRLQQEALQRGKQVTLFSRYPQKKKNTRLFTTTTLPDLERIQSLVHLAGEPILGIWTAEKRRRILESRREGTRRLVEAIAQSNNPPNVLVSSSAIGYYGDRDHEMLDESSAPGNGFLAEIAHVWEEEALKANSYGVRVVLLRIGVVLGRDGGILRLISPLFHLGLGSTLGSGTQEMSCIHIDDLVSLILHCCEDPSIEGPINAVMPHPTTNSEFTKTLATTLRRPALMRLPGFLLRAALGDLSYLLLDSQHVEPKKALAHHFQFRYPTVQQALEEIYL
ncbi:MAG: TIGR01777 family oxidoreductase [Chthoniobacterales bacterium]|nr:TIGR01777 family oxidoreductase [Chthoniobacterales bacterium]